MLSYQRGDTRAFESLYHRHKDSLFVFVYRSCARQAVAEEIAQETWMAVVDAAERYSPDARFKTWLFQIARNRSADYWRRRDNQHTPLEDGPDAPELAANSPTIDQEVLTSQLSQAIAQLPEEQRTALLLQMQGFSIDDIASISDCGKETVKSRLRYARDQLQQRMGEGL